MAEEFKIIETQEQFDSAIKSRLAREADKYEKQISELEGSNKKALAEAQKQIDELTRQISTLKESSANYDEEIKSRDAKLKEYETYSIKTQVAHELDLPYDAIKFLQGSDEGAIRESAEALKNMVGAKTMPLAKTETPVTNTTDGAYLDMARQLSK